MFKNVRVCDKAKNCTLQLTSVLKRLILARLQAFSSRIVTFKIFNTSTCFCVDHHFLYSFSFLPRVWLLPAMKASPTCSGTSDFFLLTESLGVVTEEREYIPGGFFSLICPPSGHQMLWVPLRPRVR